MKKELDIERENVFVKLSLNLQEVEFTKFVKRKRYYLMSKTLPQEIGTRNKERNVIFKTY